MLFGTIFGVWKYLDGKLTSNRTKTDNVERDLQAHRLHTAETYVTKTGLTEQTAAIMRSLDVVSGKIDKTNERFDRFLEINAKPVRRSTSQ